MFLTIVIAQTTETVETRHAASLLEEIIVTSQHGEQWLLDIPTSITTVGVRTLEDANDAGIEQDAYGLLNATLAAFFKRQGLTVSLFGSNLTGEKYLIGAGNMGAMFGVPTFVPGAPRMTGAKLTWKFNKS